MEKQGNSRCLCFSRLHLISFQMLKKKKWTLTFLSEKKKDGGLKIMHFFRLSVQNTMIQDGSANGLRS